MTTRAHGPADAGFTLIEMLLALALTGLVVGLASTAFQGLARGALRAESAADRIETLSRGLGAVRHDLQRIEPAARVERVGDEARPTLAFTGRPGELTFVRIEPGYPSEAGSYLLSYRVRPGERGGATRLMRVREPFDPHANRPKGPPSEADEVVVLEGAFDIAFAYFGAAQARPDRPEWLTTWTDPSRLPDLVRVTLTPRARGAPTVPPLHVRLRTTLQAACLLDGRPGCAAPAETGSAPAQQKARSP